MERGTYTHNMGIDLLRILCMILIPFLHIMVHGGILNACPQFSMQYNVAWFFMALAYCAVDCYALISGYVGYHSKYKYSNIIYLCVEVVFYTVLITVLFGIFFGGVLEYLVI